jgi:hypothetical protein
MLMPAAGKMHSHDSNDSVLLSPDGQRDRTWFVSGEIEGANFKATLPPGSTPGNRVQQASGMRKILALENPVGAEQTLAMWTAAK